MAPAGDRHQADQHRGSKGDRAGIRKVRNGEGKDDGGTGCQRQPCLLRLPPGAVILADIALAMQVERRRGGGRGGLTVVVIMGVRMRMVVTVVTIMVVVMATAGRALLVIVMVP